MATHLLQRLLAAGRATAQTLRRRLADATRPATAPLVAGTLADLARSRPELLAEHAFLRQQLLILRRQARRPRCAPAERTLLVLRAGRLRTWRSVSCSVSSSPLPVRRHRVPGRGSSLGRRGRGGGHDVSEPQGVTMTALRHFW